MIFSLFVIFSRDSNLTTSVIRLYMHMCMCMGSKHLIAISHCQSSSIIINHHLSRLLSIIR